jgi:citrate lyase subunit beta/citryl-CoA lyase
MSLPPTAPRIRSALFVPGSRADFLAKALRLEADGIIVDLEDAVSSGLRDQARTHTGAWIASQNRNNPAIMVRISALDENVLDQDLSAIVHENLRAVLVPKLSGADEVRVVADMLSYYEGRAGLDRGSIFVWPLIETAAAVQQAGDIARASGRIAYMGGGSSQGGDLACDLGFEWTAAGLETIYTRSKVLVDARAARVPNPMTGLVSTIATAETTEFFARQARQLGYAGMMAIHPAQVPIINKVFTPSLSDLVEAKAVLDALKAGEEVGKGATTLDGRMLDRAMARHAAILLEDAERSPVSVD